MKNFLIIKCIVLFLFCYQSVVAQVVVQNSQKEEMVDSLSAIRVNAEKRKKSTLYKVTEKELKVTLTPMGEADVIKYIQTLPGISTGMEGTSAIYVRGGNMGNNLISLDGIPIYGSGHLLGMTSVFSPAIVGNTEFLREALPRKMLTFRLLILNLPPKTGIFKT